MELQDGASGHRHCLRGLTGAIGSSSIGKQIWIPDLDPQHQCCGSMKFWCGSGSGSADPCVWQMDPDPTIFVIDLQDANKKLIYSTFFCLLLFEGTLTSFSKIKSQKKSHKAVGIKQCCGSGTGSVRIRNFWPDPDPIRNRNKHFGSVFGSGFRIRIRIRIPNKWEKRSLIFRLK